jgi:hypothetical protein
MIFLIMKFHLPNTVHQRQRIFSDPRFNYGRGAAAAKTIVGRCVREANLTMKMMLLRRAGRHVPLGALKGGGQQPLAKQLPHPNQALSLRRTIAVTVR